MSSEGANDLEVKLSLDKIIGKNESEVRNLRLFLSIMVKNLL